jgi:hypothetical protein
MNRKQRACIVSGFFLLLLSLLFPPTHPYRSPLVSYSFLFSGQGAVDFGRLLAEWMLLVLVMGGLLVIANKSKNSTIESSNESNTASPKKARALPLVVATLAVLVLCLSIVSYSEAKKVWRLEAGIRNIKTVLLESQQPDLKVGADALRVILDPVQVPNDLKHQAWDDFYAAQSAEDFKARFDALALPNATKAALWDLKFAWPTHLATLTPQDVLQADSQYHYTADVWAAWVVVERQDRIACYGHIRRVKEELSKLD